MAFHPCSGLGIFLVLAAVICLIFAEIGQISDSQSIPRHIRLAVLDTTDFGVGLAAASGGAGNLTGLYSSTAGGAGQNGTGIAISYEWGLWGFCESQVGTGDKPRFCNSTQWGQPFKPWDSLLADVSPDYQSPVRAVIPNSTFTATHYLAHYSSTGFWFVFVGALLAGLALFIAFGAHRFAYLFSALLGFLAAILVAIGGIIYTVIIAKTRNGINDLHVTGGTPLGLHVEYGNALWLIWGAVGSLILSILPFFFACCAIRGRTYY